MILKDLIKINIVLLAAFFSLSANAATISLDTYVEGVYLGNDDDAADFLLDTGIVADDSFYEIFRDDATFEQTVESITCGGGGKKGQTCATTTSIIEIFSGEIAPVADLEYLVVKFDGVYGVYDVSSIVYADGDVFAWATADFASGCAVLALTDSTINCDGATSHLTGYGTPAVVPVPAAVWLFVSGLLGLVGVARKRA